MTVDELKAELPDVVAVLSALAGVLPSRVDPELVGYLERAAAGGIEAELLHAALTGGAKATPRLKVR